MRTATIITGLFNADVNAAQFLSYLCRLGIAVENISISPVVPRSFLAVHPDKGEAIIFIGLSGSIAGVLIAMLVIAVSAPWGLWRDLGLPSMAVGAVLGCMCGTLIGCFLVSVLSYLPDQVRQGSLAGNQVVIDVQLAEHSSEKDALKAIMQEFGAVVTVQGQGAPAPRKLGRPPFSPN